MFSRHISRQGKKVGQAGRADGRLGRAVDMELLEVRRLMAVVNPMALPLQEQGGTTVTNVLIATFEVTTGGGMSPQASVTFAAGVTTVASPAVTVAPIGVVNIPGLGNVTEWAAQVSSVTFTAATGTSQFSVGLKDPNDGTGTAEVFNQVTVTPAAPLPPFPLAYTAPSDGKEHNLLLQFDSSGSVLQISDNATVVESLPVGEVTNIEIAGGANTDNTLTVNYANGLFTKAISFDGGAGTGSHSLTVEGASGSADVYTPGPALGAGTLAVGSDTIQFIDLSPVLDLNVGTLAVNGTSGNDVISYGPGVADATDDGLVTVNNLESIEFSNKSVLTLNTGAGTDSVNIANPNTPIGLTEIQVNGGSPSAGDSITETGVSGAADQFVVNPNGAGAGTIDDDQLGTTFALQTPVVYSGLGSINLVGQFSDKDQVQETNPLSNSTLVWTPGATPGSATLTGNTSGYAFVPVNYSGFTGQTFLGSGNGSGSTGGILNITINGTSGNDQFSYVNHVINTLTLSNSTGTYQTLSWDPASASEGLTLDGGQGSDTYDFIIDGSAPNNFAISTDSKTADVVNYYADTSTTVNLHVAVIASADAPNVNYESANTVMVNAGGNNLTVEGFASASTSDVWTPGAGTITSGPVTVETSDIGGTLTLNPLGGSLTVQGTSGDDNIVATGDPTSPTLQVGSLTPAVLVAAETTMLYINGGSGNDNLTVDSSASAFTIPITYDGGTGNANSLTLTGGLATSDAYTPGPLAGAGASELVIGGATESVQFQNLAPVTDSVVGPLAVTAPAGNSAINYGEAGTDPTSGEVGVNSFEPIIFTNKFILNLNAGFGTNTITLSNNSTPTALTEINVTGGSSLDTLIDNAFGSAVTQTAIGTAGVLNLGGPVPVDYSQVEAVQVINAVDSIATTPATIVAVEGKAFTSVNVGTFTGGPIGAVAGDFKATINWGDGKSSAGNVTGSAGSFSIAGSHTYAAAGTFSPVVTVTDSKLTSSATVGGVPITIDYTTPLSAVIDDTASVSEPSVIATAILTPVVTINQNTSTGTIKLATFTDPNGAEALSHYSASIDWGDGQVSSGTIAVAKGVFTITGNHTYAVAGTFSPVITISHDASTPTVVTDTNRIEVVSPDIIHATGTKLTGYTGRATSGTVANFTVANTALLGSAFTATISWGDGTATSAGTIVRQSAGKFYVVGSHVYAKKGTYTMTITITETGGFSAVVNSTAKIAASPVD